MQKLEGYRTWLFFALALLLWLANQFGFADFAMTPEQKEWFDFVVIVGGFALRYITSKPLPFLQK